MQLYLMRHGIAGQHGDPHYPNDDERPLTKKGVKKLEEQLPGLQEFGVKPDLIIASPLARARQTAAIIAQGLRLADHRDNAARHAYVADERLAPGASADDLLLVIETHLTEEMRQRQPDDQELQIMIISHEPDLSQAAAQLSGGLGDIWLRKGGLIRLDLGSLASRRGVLRWLLEPEHLQIRKGRA